MSFSPEWEQTYKNNAHLSIWPWSDLVSFVMRYARPTGPKFRVLEPARLPLEPVKPRKILVVLGGFVVGLLLGTSAVYLLDLSNTSIRSLDEARTVLEFPIFGSIPPIDPEELMIQESLRRAGSV